ncbi:MAG TPA: aminotransferase class I/II-fold pyridoxal phosphate-dependent enzyme [Gemmatimonadaceae bacterium]|nr:aminotransferase class I/II-fold pyridoxal phosphate-dependent enzyme [Gemmatimonadaceae bacterium]
MTNARRTETFTESVIREMTRVAQEHDAINLAQGFPDFPMPAAMKAAACDAINSDVNQYAITWGAKSLRDAISSKYARRYGMEVDPERDVTVACGATEAMAAVFLALLDPGDEVLIFEPFYENYGPDAILCGAHPVFVPLAPPDWQFDGAALRASITPRTRALVLNSPHNPTGHVFSREELATIARVCIEHNLIVLTDDPYEYILFRGEHVPIATLPGMRDRTVTISSLSKTFSITGWRIGYAIASGERTSAIRKVHDFLTVGAPAPLQEAAAIGYSFGDDYYRALSADYQARRDYLGTALRQSGFRFAEPQGAYYFLAEFGELSDRDDVTFAKWMAKEIGVASVPGSSFFRPGSEAGKRYVRFAFCKTQQTLERAVERLSKLAAAV